uniref:Uncharacterized protein n=1 Tax=Kalanchoe fedtschenkoi TaxID=63787 RepID=A0A7N0TXE4_KALFE
MKYVTDNGCMCRSQSYFLHPGLRLSPLFFISSCQSTVLSSTLLSAPHCLQIQISHFPSSLGITNAITKRSHSVNNNSASGMNRSLKDSLLGGGINAPCRTGRSINGALPRESGENLDLFSKSRRGFSLASSDDSEVSMKLSRLSLGSGNVAINGVDDLLTFPYGGKNDYDWLLTPPGTPLIASSDSPHQQPTTLAPRSCSTSRNGSAVKNSRLSVMHTESNNSSKPTRSSSVTRPSVSASQHTSNSSNRSSSVLNISSASVPSYIRPSSPMARKPFVSRPSTAPSRPSLSRSTTPSTVRSTPSTSSIDKPRLSSNSRPSTPKSMTPTPPNLTSSTPRLNSRPSTPTRRLSAPSVSSTAPVTTPGRRLSSSGLATTTSGSRPSSPSLRQRPLLQASVIPTFPNETPSNLRTTLPDRALSAGRLRPGLSVTGKGKTDTPTLGNSARMQPSPVGTRWRVREPTAKVCVQSGGNTEKIKTCRTLHLQDSHMNKSISIPSTTLDNTGFVRSISKKSSDMVIRTLDIRNGTSSNIRQLSGTTLFPQSVRSSAGIKPQAVHTSNDFGSINIGSLPDDRAFFENGNHMSASVKCRNEEVCHLSAKTMELDIYDSARYDAILLKEDLKNMYWLHSFDGHFNQGSLFDAGFDTLPEPFDPL